MTVYAYSHLPAFNPNTNPTSVAKSATGSVYDINDTGFLTPLNLTLVATNTVTTTLVSDSLGMFPDFTLVDRTQCVFKSGTIPFILTTTTPIPGPTGAASTVPGPPGPPTTDASLLTAGTVDDARLPTRLLDAQLTATYLPKWKANTFYLAGAQVVAPTGETVSAKVDFTSGATFSAANWNFPAGGGAVSSVVGQTGAVTGSQILADTTVAAALAAKAPLANPTFTGTVSGVTQTMVGLDQVSNTSDVNKPVSTAQATAIALKLDASQKGAVNGVATLDGGGKVPSTQIGDLSAQIAPQVDPVTTTTMIRPNRWTRVYRVNTAGTDGAYTTIGAAMTQANTDRNANTGGNFDACPYFRGLILVDPGTYNETVSMGGYVDIVGSSGVRDDVVISWTGNNPVIEASGSSAYLAHLNLQFGGTTSTTGTYALHSDSVQTYPSTLICDDVWFESTNPNRTSAMGIGTAGGQMQFFNNCVFKVASGDAINYHNTATQKLPSFAIFNNCNTQGTPARTLLTTDLGSGQQDIVMWRGGSMLGSTLKAALVNTAGTKTMQVVIDPAIAASSEISASTTGYVVRAKAFPVAPVAGMSRAETDFFYPVKLSAPGVTIGLDAAPDAASGAPVAQRVYYYPIQIPNGMQIQSFRVPVITAAGTVAAGLMKDDGTGKPGGYLQRTNATTATVGTMTVGGTITKRTIFPGYSQLWLAVVASSASSALVMSNMISTLTPCYYQDVADGQVPTSPTPVLLAAGSAVPLIGVIAL